MDIKKFKDFLRCQDEECLREELLTLYRTFNAVKEFYGPRVEPTNVEKVIEKYKQILEKQFYPKKGFPPLNYSIARKAISDFKKISSDITAIIDLQLTYVEYGVDCTLEYGDIDARFYDSMESMFRKTLKDAYENGFLDQFKDRFLDIQERAGDLGWGFGDAITELCEEYFHSEKQEEIWV